MEKSNIKMNQVLKITQSSDAAGILRDYMSNLDHEEMWAMFLTIENGLIDQEMLTKGTLTSTLIDARTIIKHSLMNNAAGVIIIHNHPSGNPKPSPCDVRETQNVRDACKLMDISLVDHIVISRDSYYSFADESISNYTK